MTEILMIRGPGLQRLAAVGRSRIILAAFALLLLLTGCSFESDTTTVPPGDTEEEPSASAPMPSGSFVGEWPNDPGAFANNSRATGSFELITVEVSGDTWHVATSYATTIPVGGGCFSTVTHTISGEGPVLPDGSGPLLQGEVNDQWMRERGGEECANPRSDEGTQFVTVSLSYIDGELDGWIEGHNVTLTQG